MPERIHALLVVRAAGRRGAAEQLRRALDALAAQRRPIDALTLVLCGGRQDVFDIASASGAEGVITAAPSTRFAAAVRLARPRLQGAAIWLLNEETFPDPEALARLDGALQAARNVSIAAPKLVNADEESQIVSLGVTMTSLGRAVGLADDELDQGQHDHTEDVLGVDIRGVLVRAETWGQLDGIDEALHGADEGLDLGVRARLGGTRVTVVPRAVVAVADVPGQDSARGRRRRYRAERIAQLHRRLVYAPALAVPLHWLLLWPLAVWTSMRHLIAKRPSYVGPEWTASIVAWAQLTAVARARRRLRAHRSVTWRELAPLRITRARMSQRVDAEAHADAAALPVREELRFFAAGGAWLVLASLLVSLVAFSALLAWPALGGNALLPLSSSLSQLWSDVLWGPRPIGIDQALPAGPFSFLLAVLGSLAPAAPSRALVVLWILALPLSTLGGWFAAARVTTRPALQAFAAIIWTLSPTLLIALSDGRPGAVIAHLALPWVFFAGSVAHRSWAAAGGASLAVAVTAAAAPSLLPALLTLWVIVMLLVLVVRSGRGVGPVVWTIIPTLVLFAPLAWEQGRVGNWLGLLADPGVPVGSGITSTPADRLALVFGFPTVQTGGWHALTVPGGGWEALPVWTPFALMVPLIVVALLSLLTPRWFVAVGLWLIAGLGMSTAVATLGIAVSFNAAEHPVALWPGAGLSLMWAALVAAAVVALDAGIGVSVRPLRAWGAVLLAVTVAVCALPPLTATLRGQAAITESDGSTLPALVAATAPHGVTHATLVMDPLNDGSLHATLVWGPSETLDGTSTINATRTTPTAQQTAFASLVAAIATTPRSDVITQAAAQGVQFFVLSPPVPGESDAAQALRQQAASALSQNSMLQSVGSTPKGELWIVKDGVTVADRATPSGVSPALAAGVLVVQALILLAGILLSVPTAASRREAARTSRVVGPRVTEEER